MLIGYLELILSLKVPYFVSFKNQAKSNDPEMVILTIFVTSFLCIRTSSFCK